MLGCLALQPTALTSRHLPAEQVSELPQFFAAAVLTVIVVFLLAAIV